MNKLSRTEVAQAILNLSDKRAQSKLAAEIAAYLVDNRRTGELDAIMREVARLRQNKEGVTEVTVTSARKLDASAIREVQKILGTKKLTINEVVDPDLIGGVRLETSETMLDLSVRNRLNQLKAAV